MSARTLAAAVSLFACEAISAQDYPTKPVRLLVGFPPGGAVDVVARLLQPRLAQALNAEIVVDNRPGAGGVLAADLVARSAPDGYTLCLINHAALVISPAITKVPYQPTRDFTPIARVVQLQNIFLVHSSLPVHSLQELVTLARARPGALNYATSGVGSAGHLTAELFKTVAGIAWMHVPYKGGAPAMTDFLAGQVEVFVATTSTAIPHIRQGKARALAVSGNRRAMALPEVPTVSESGWPGFQSSAWFAAVGPADLPNAIVERWHREIERALGLPDIRQALLERGMDVFPGSPSETAAYLREEIAKWSPIVRAAGLQTN